MDKKKIAIGLGVLGVGALGYYAYMKSKASANLANGQLYVNNGVTYSVATGQPVTSNQLPASNFPASIQQPTSTLSAYEGKGFRNTDDGKIYIVKGGVLRHMTSPAVMQRELGSNNWQQLASAGIITQVNTSFINQFTVGATLSGFGSISPAI